MIKRLRLSRLVLSTALFALGLLGIGELHGQSATLQGRVTHSATGEPIRGVEVVVRGTNLTTVTSAGGQFMFPQVPIGEHTIEFHSIGYEVQIVQVTITAGSPTTVNVTLEPELISLGEIVVTGTGMPTERRRLGQTINTVSAEDLATAPIMTAADALQGRMPGVVGFSGAETGQGSLLTLRGAVSLTQSNEPLIYVDGVRVDNTRDRVGMIAASPLNDINPMDIDRIEVIKGAAAATLYGTEASAGVIQIFTKRGTTGEPSFTFQIDQHVFALDKNRVPRNYGLDTNTGALLTNRPSDDFLRTGRHQNYALSFRGGTEAARYAGSLRYMDEVGITPQNDHGNIALRTNLDLHHSTKLSSSLGVSWTRSTVTSSMPTWGIFAEFLLANPVHADDIRPYGEQDNTIQGVLDDENTRLANNLVLSGNVSYQWSDDVRSTVTLGFNSNSVKHERFRPEGSGVNVRGLRSVRYGESNTISLDANTSWEHRLGERWASTLVFGGQSFWETRSSAGASVQDFPSPTLRTLTAGTTPSSPSESYTEVINAGVFIQEQIGLDDRMFLTLGLRADGNSAFGKNFGMETYPKIGFSWVVSDHDFWTFDAIPTLRVRSAIGSSGQQPGVFDAQRIWSPGTSAGNNAVVIPSNLGNPDLRPERSTERELGIEATMLDGRIGVDFVIYDHKTTDALLRLNPAPSLGFLGSQLHNVGQLSSRGTEMAVHLMAIRRPNFNWNINASFTTIKQRVDDLGDSPPFPVGLRRNRGYIHEGYAPGAMLSEMQDPDHPYTTTVPVEDVTNVNQIVPNLLQTSGGQDSLVHVGDALPTWTINLGSNFDFAENIHVRAVFAGAGGFKMHDETDMVRSIVGVSERAAKAAQVLADPNSTVEEKRAAIDSYGKRHPDIPAGYMFDGRYLRMTELSLTYSIPDHVSELLRLGSTMITLSGRNLFTLTPYKGLVDPGAGWRTDPDGLMSGILSGANVDYMRAPLPRRFILSVRTTW